MENNELGKIQRGLIKVNIILTITLLLIAVCAARWCNHFTKTTIALSEIAQKVDVDFPTRTNNVLGVWQIVKPK